MRLSEHQIKTIKRLTKADTIYHFNGDSMSTHIFISTKNNFKLLLEVDRTSNKPTFYTSYNETYYGDKHTTMREIYEDIKNEQKQLS